MRQAKIFIDDVLAGLLIENEYGYSFQYTREYLNGQNPRPVSLSLALQKEAFSSENLFPFFDGLIPEGWLLDIAQHNWKLNPRDRMGLLMATCKDCIGNISVVPV